MFVLLRTGDLRSWVSNKGFKLFPFDFNFSFLLSWKFPGERKNSIKGIKRNNLPRKFYRFSDPFDARLPVSKEIWSVQVSSKINHRQSDSHCLSLDSGAGETSWNKLCQCIKILRWTWSGKVFVSSYRASSTSGKLNKTFVFFLFVDNSFLFALNGNFSLSSDSFDTFELNRDFQSTEWRKISWKSLEFDGNDE